MNENTTPLGQVPDSYFMLWLCEIAREQRNKYSFESNIFFNTDAFIRAGFCMPDSRVRFITGCFPFLI